MLVTFIWNEPSLKLTLPDNWGFGRFLFVFTVKTRYVVFFSGEIGNCLTIPMGILCHSFVSRKNGHKLPKTNCQSPDIWWLQGNPFVFGRSFACFQGQKIWVLGEYTWNPKVIHWINASNIWQFTHQRRDTSISPVIQRNEKRYSNCHKSNVCKASEV